MRRTFAVAILLAVAFLALAPRRTLADGSWLDAPQPAAFNTPGARLPAAPPANNTDPRCVMFQRPAETVEDGLVTGAGWGLVGAYEAGWGLRLITATSDYDGMCRPASYQTFVFVDGAYAGSLSPVLMFARMDGAETVSRILARTGVSATFVRYSSTDPACCPSQVTYVGYRIDQTPAGAVVVPTDATTQKP